jgi:hypothetical protein
MSDLPLAVDIAETVTQAASDGEMLDTPSVADALLAAHPEAGATREAVLEALHQEGAAAGVIPPKPRALTGS